MSPPTANSPADYPPCVEHSVWTPIPVPPPAWAAAAEAQGRRCRRIQSGQGQRDAFLPPGRLHGRFREPPAGNGRRPGHDQTGRMPQCFGGLAGVPKASFFFHLGDIVYKDEDKTDLQRADQQKLYNEHFYTPYAGYPRNIFAIAGNHDGKDCTHEEKSAVRHFLKNFCDCQRSIPPDNKTTRRATMGQPYPYWFLRTPLAYIVGLYANDINGGQLDDPQSDDTPQYDWLMTTLKSIRKDGDGRFVFVAVHYPPYSAASNFLQRGDPNLGPTPRPRRLQRARDDFAAGIQPKQAIPGCRFFGPCASLPADHVHLRRRPADPALDRRLRRPRANRKFSRRLRRNRGAPPALPADAVLPPGLVLPAGEKPQLVAYNDKDFGFARVTIDAKRKVMQGEFFTAYSAVRGTAGLPALADSFTLDLAKHRLV